MHRSPPKSCTPGCRKLVVEPPENTARAAILDPGDRYIDHPLNPALTARQALDIDAIAERWVLSARRERLDRIIFFGMDHLRHALQEYVAHYNEERPHQGLGNELVSGAAPATGTGRVTKNERLGGLLNSYRRAA